MSSAISLGNGKTITGSASVTLKKRIGYYHVFVNAGVAGPTNNTGITLRDLTIDDTAGVGGSAITKPRS